MTRRELPIDLKGDVLELTWLVARRAAKGQNCASVYTFKQDRRFTIANVGLPVFGLAVSLCHSIALVFDRHSQIPFIEVMGIITAAILFVSYLQLVGDFKARSIEHRQASNAFAALADKIQSVGFIVEDDVAFESIINSLEQIQQSCRYVPKEHWDIAQEQYYADIERFRSKLRAYRSSPEAEEYLRRLADPQ